MEIPHSDINEKNLTTSMLLPNALPPLSKNGLLRDQAAPALP